MRRRPLRRFGRKMPVTKELDRLLRAIVMERDGWACRRCGKASGRGRGGACETAHIYPKGRHPSMRYRLDNVLALCHACHHHFAHKDPVNFVLWLRQELGPQAMDRLTLVAMTPGKVNRSGDLLYLKAQAKKYGVSIEETPTTKRRKT